MLENLPFHQFQRYKILEKIISSLRGNQESLRILEVGAGKHRNAEKFLPLDQFIYLDVSYPEEYLKNPVFVMGDATKLIYEDNEFDYVVALDVYEHIENEKKNDFLKEITRVSRKGIILSAPFSKDNLESLEKNLNIFCENLELGYKVDWLEEHLKLGLPDFRSTYEFLGSECKLALSTFSHGDRKTSDSLLALELLGASKPQIQRLFREMNYYYNTEVFENDFCKEYGVRDFIIGLNSPDDIKKITFGKDEIFQCKSKHSYIRNCELRVRWNFNQWRKFQVYFPSSLKRDFTVDVLLVTYNQEKYIRQAIESILMQETDFRYRIVLCDDASKDETRQIVEEYSKEYPDIFCIMDNEENLGITKNYQRGFQFCEGKYVAVIEGDDFWNDSDKLQKQVDFLEENLNCSMCFCKLNLYLEDEKQYCDHNIRNLDQLTYLSASDLALNNFIGNFSCCMYRTKALKEIDVRIYDLKAYDWITNLAVALSGKIGIINKRMSTYRIHSKGTWSNSAIEEKENEILSVLDAYDNFFKGKFYQEFATVRKGILRKRHKRNKEVSRQRRKKWKDIFRKIFFMKKR